MGRAWIAVGLIVSAGAAAGAAGGCCAARSGTANRPPRTDERWLRRFEELSAAAQRGEARLVFIGDSITQGWRGAGREVWRRYYEKRRALNLGVGGDRTRDVLWRLRNGNLGRLSPRVAVLMIGVNNTFRRANAPGQIADEIIAIVRLLRARLPATRILLLGILPVGPHPNAQRARCARVNRLASRVADGRMVHYLDLGARFMSAEGRVSRSIMPDYLHLSAEGYATWAEAMEPTLRRLLGEPGEGEAGARGRK
jgi:lysophospholipase L1-like esterase